MAALTIEACVKIVRSCNVDNEEIKCELFANAVRELRNYCTRGKKEQTFIAQQDGLLAKTSEIVRVLLNKEEYVPLYLCMQFIANVLVGHRENRKVIWQSFKSTLQRCLTVSSPKVQHCSAMIIYNVLLDEEILRTISDPLLEIIQLTQNEDTSEYALFILELFICQTHYVSQYYHSMDTQSRIILLNVLESIHRNPDGKSFSKGMLRYLADYFASRAEIVIHNANDEIEELDAHEVVQVLNIINAISSSNSDYLNEVQSSEDLLTVSVGVLRDVHNLSKEKGNKFTMLLKLAELEGQPSEEIQDHPAFGFKAALVRLIGNLSWKHKENQDICREMGVIPLILDCCNIDARNPLIIQWAVLAMRNLCEGNRANQMVVASVDRRGEVDSKRLAELGLIFNGSSQ